jgi:hypothetical protein
LSFNVLERREREKRKIIIKENNKKPMWPHRSVIPALGKLRLEDGKFKANLGCIV